MYNLKGISPIGIMLKRKDIRVLLFFLYQYKKIDDNNVDNAAAYIPINLISTISTTRLIIADTSVVVPIIFVLLYALNIPP